MRELHHFGIPTDKKQKNESYLAGAKLFVTDASKSPNKIEWLRYEPDSPLPDILKKVPHIAYMVDNIKSEITGKELLLDPFSPMPGLTVAFVMEEGIPIEFMQITQ